MMRLKCVTVTSSRSVVFNSTGTSRSYRTSAQKSDAEVALTPAQQLKIQMKKEISRPPTAFALFLKNGWATQQFTGKSVIEAGKLAGIEWAKLTENQKASFIDNARKMLEDYRKKVSDFKAVHVNELRPTGVAAVPRAVNAYALFIQANKGKFTKFADAAKMWKELPAAEADKYKEAATKQREQYVSRLLEYKKERPEEFGLTELQQAQKRVPSGYLIFFKESRERFVKPGKKATEVLHDVAKAWSALSEAERTEFNKRSASLREAAKSKVAQLIKGHEYIDALPKPRSPYHIWLSGEGKSITVPEGSSPEQTRTALREARKAAYASLSTAQVAQLKQESDKQKAAYDKIVSDYKTAHPADFKQ